MNETYTLEITLFIVRIYKHSNYFVPGIVKKAAGGERKHPLQQ